MTSKCATTTTCVGANAATGRDVYYAYDLVGNQLSAKFDSATGSDGVTNGYDGFGDLASSATSIGGFSKSICSAAQPCLYDLNGNRTRIIHPDGQAFTYTYDGLDRPIQIGELGQLESIGYIYDNFGRLSLMDRRNGRDTIYQFDSMSRVAALINTNYVNNPADVRFDFSFNPASQATARSMSNDTYAFDGLVTVNRPYTTNGLNQYSAAGSAAFCYDGNGNLTADGTYAYKYDIENRLIEKRNQVSPACPVTDYSGTLLASLIYDPLGRLWQVIGVSTNTRFLYDGNALVAEYDAAGNLVGRYVHGSNRAADDPLLDYQGAGLTAKRYLEADRQGSVILLSDSSGAAISTNRYDEYGIPSSSNSGRFQYTGQMWIGELGMYYYKARVYSPTLGRFLQTDPIGYAGGMNIYGYVANDPVNGIDPLGLDNCDIEGPTAEQTTHRKDCVGDKKAPPATPEEEAAVQNAIIVTGQRFRNRAPVSSPLAMIYRGDEIGAFKGIDGQLFFVPLKEHCEDNGNEVGILDPADLADGDFGGHAHGTNNSTGVGTDDAVMAASVRGSVAVQIDRDGMRVVQRTRGGSYRVIAVDGQWGDPGRSGTQAQVNTWNRPRAAASGTTASAGRAGDVPTTGCK